MSGPFHNDYLVDSEVTEAENILKNGEICKLITRKRKDYYKFTYDPTYYFNRLRQIGIEEDAIKNFDSTIRYNCCNVVSIMLYLIHNNDEITRYFMYIGCIRQTVFSVRRNLPDWIVRIYLDSSVYDSVKRLGDVKDKKTNITVRQMSEDIIESPNVEIYTYDCDSYKQTCKDDCVPISRTRILRYLVMADPEVNMYAIREADGIVGNLDCHNIRMFEKDNDKLIYISCLAGISQMYREKENNGDIESYWFPGYQSWLILFKHYVRLDYFLRKHNLYDLLAGVFTCKLKINYDHFMSVANILKNELDDFMKIDIKDRIDVITQKQDGHPFQPYKSIIITGREKFDLCVTDSSINIGYDECLLLDLFKDLVSPKYELHNYPRTELHRVTFKKEDIQKIESILISSKIKTFELIEPDKTNNSIAGCVKLFSKNNIISKKWSNIDIPKYKKDMSINDYSNYNIVTYDNALIDIIVPEPFNIIIKDIYKYNILDICNYAKNPTFIDKCLDEFKMTFDNIINPINPLNPSNSIEDNDRDVDKANDNTNKIQKGNNLKIENKQLYKDNKTGYLILSVLALNKFLNKS